MDIKKLYALILWTIFFIFLTLFFLFRETLQISLPFAFLAMGVLFYLSSQKKKDFGNEFLKTIGLGAFGSLVASLFSDVMREALTPTIISGYVVAFITFIILIILGILGKEN